MTSPRQRKKRLAFKKIKEKLEKRSAVVEHKPIVVEKQAHQQKEEPQKTVAAEPQPVVESPPEPKAKKARIGLTELKSQEQVVEQSKEEVKTETKE